MVFTFYDKAANYYLQNEIHGLSDLDVSLSFSLDVDITLNVNGDDEVYCNGDGETHIENFKGTVESDFKDSGEFKTIYYFIRIY